MKSLKKNIFLLFFMLLSLPAFSYNKKDLLKAVQENSIQKVHQILVSNFELSTMRFDNESNTILMIALQNKCDAKIIDMILKSGCSPTAKNRYGKTALMFACENSYNTKIITQLLNYNTLTKSGKIKKILQCDKDGKNSFDYAKDNEQAYALFLKFTKDPKTTVANQTEDSPETQQEQQEQQETTTDESISKAADNAESSIEQTPLTEDIETTQSVEPVETIIPASIQEDKTEIADNTNQTENLIEQPSTSVTTEAEKDIQLPDVANIDTVITIPPIDYYNRNKPEYLFDQIDAEHEIEKELGNNSTIKFTLIKNPDTLDANGRTKLMTSIINQDLKLCYDLINSGADVNYKDKEGFTPLMYACKYSTNQNIINLLFSHNANINIKTNYNLSTLQIAAAFCNDKEVLSIILSKANQENIDITESFITALKEARPKDIILQFLPYIKNINILYKGKTPLMYCAEYYQNTDVIQLLLENGADPYIISSEKKNAFTYAKQNERIIKDSIYWSLNVSTSEKR